jgi:mannose-1-phosphate guanylyltransferase
MIVTPADHLILDAEEFRDIAGRSLAATEGSDHMMTIGIKPTGPNTGYGYIQLDDDKVKQGDITSVKTFTEKPELELAKAFVASGEFLWNSGIFLFNVRTFLHALEEHLPDMYGLFSSAQPHYGTPRESEYIQKIYPECRPVSIDIGIMEKAHNVYVCCGDFGWSDIGTWGSLYDYSAKDDSENVAPYNSLLVDSRGCIVKMPDNRIAVIAGLRDYIVVESGDVLMICPREQEQDIKRYVEDLKFRGIDSVV